MADQELLTVFGTRIREFRTARGLSQEQLADETGFHRTYIGCDCERPPYKIHGLIGPAT